MAEGRRSTAPILLFTAGVFCGVVVGSVASAQILTLSPQCGIAGTTSIDITGAGWAEPSPPCEYIFYLNGVEVAPRQPDGLFGPPAAAFTIPPGTPAGCHIVKVELRITDTQALVQCRQDTLRVLVAEADPWTVTLEADSSGITIDFDPTAICDIGVCDAVYFIQTRKLTGTRNNGTTRSVTYVEQGWANGNRIDSTFTGAGVAIDRIFGAPVPYYGQPAGSSSVGSSGKRPVVASMFDRPQRPDASYPTMPDTIVKLTLDFEVNVFCGAGADRGKFMGRFTWQWMRSKGAASGRGKVTTGATSRSQPTATFGPALDLWNMKNNFTLPTEGPPQRGGVPCS
jgi:hypothetical protein